MSSSTSINDSTDVTESAGLTESERETFQRLLDDFGDDHDIGRIARAVLHSDSDSSEDTNS
jgi:hypothetical protein